MQKHLIFTLLAIMAYFSVFAQESTLSSDDLFSLARKAAFDNKNYTEAIRLSHLALEKSPDYSDISIFLGRLYTWSDKVDSARFVFNNLALKGEETADFFLAYASLEYWNDNSQKANTLLDKALLIHPASSDLWLLKAKVNYSDNAFDIAKNAIEKVLDLDPKNTEARALAKSIIEYSAKNTIGITYNYVHFDKQFEDDWHIVGLSYKRQTNLGSIIFKTNYANKFNASGTQFELEAYPRISKLFYLYVGAGYSNNVGIFPKYRAGTSLYMNLPQSFEGEIGIRHLHFSENLLMYTGSVGKYYQNFWFNLRTFITPSEQNIAHSYTFTTRYYTKSADEYIGFLIGTGISPEENRNNLLNDDFYKMKTYKIGVDYNFKFKKTNKFNVSATYYNQEFRPKQIGNQFDINIGYAKIF